MSLFENDQYQWRETYFVLFDEGDRPRTETLLQALHELGKQFELSNVQSDDEGRFESLTVASHEDYAAMDISYMAGEEVIEQVAELCKDLGLMVETAEEKKSLSRLTECTARLDVYHFEQNAPSGFEEDEPELMDPGALLSVMERLATLCNGVAVDPQTGFLI